MLPFNAITARYILAVLNGFEILSEFVYYVVKETELPIICIECGWKIPHLRMHLATLNDRVTIEQVWSLKY